MYINKPTQTSSFWKIYRELQKTKPRLYNELMPKNINPSLSFELPTSNKDDGIIIIKHQKNRMIKSPRIMTQFGVSVGRASKIERADFLEVIAHVSASMESDQVKIKKKVSFRRASQYEFIGSKQKRLTEKVPYIQVQQHSHEAEIVRKKKINRLRNQYKFIQRSKQRKNYGQKRSKSCPFLKKEPKISHIRAKTIADIQYQGPILPINFELQRKIALICYKSKVPQLMFRRLTYVKVPRLSVCVSKEKLLNIQDTLTRQLEQQKQFASETSVSNSPPPIQKLNFKKAYFQKLQSQDVPKQYFTPRYHNEQSSNIIKRRSSFNVISKWIQEKSKQLKQNSDKQQLPLVQQQPSLGQLNQYYLSTQRSDGVISSKQSTHLLLQSKASVTVIQDELSPTSKQKIDLTKLQFTKQQSQNSQLLTYNRIRTLPSDHSSNSHRNKMFYQQKLKPYLQ